MEFVMQDYCKDLVDKCHNCSSLSHSTAWAFITDFDLP